MDAIATLANVKEALSVYDIDERNAVMQAVFGDEGAKGLTPLLQKLKELKEQQRDVEEGSRKLIDASYGEFLEGGSGPLNMFVDNLKSVGATIGSTLLPAVNGALWPLNKVLITTGELIEDIPQLGMAIGGLAAAFTAFKTYRVLRGVGGLLGGLRRRRGGLGGALTNMAGSDAGGVIAVRVINWPGGGFGGDIGGRRGRGVGHLPGRFGGRGVGRLLQGGGKLLGKAALPLAAGMTALDVAQGVANGDARQVGGGLGGAGGAVAGAAAGAAIGSVVPVIGTAVGGLVGSIVGGFGGDWLGRKIGGLFEEGGELPKAAVAKATPEEPVQAAPVENGDRRATTNVFNMTINGAPGQDIQALADEVVKRLRIAGREALHD